MARIDDAPRPALHWKPHADSRRIECQLCPRHCRTAEGQDGFCRVRGHRDGKYVTFNYGRSVEVAQESIETEAVFHWAPGARILSLGNVGCMMNCSYCHNWQTSQVKHLDVTNVRQYTPEQVVELALEHEIRILSWTYNDPVVWHEFVLDTARLAARHGIGNLYKSAFYIEERPAAELIEVMDIFSISLKSMSPELYRRVTGGKLQPVLDRIQQVHRSGRHLEISQLLVTDMNDAEADVTRTVEWVHDHLGPATPLHFVRFHPAYRYTHTGRTPVGRLTRAREIAHARGMHYCYIGNVYRPGVSDTRCVTCDQVLVSRFGLSVETSGLDARGACTACGTAGPIRRLDLVGSASAAPVPLLPEGGRFRWEWTEEVNSLHAVLEESAGERVPLVVETMPRTRTRVHWMGRGLNRVMFSRSSENEQGIDARWPAGCRVTFLPVLDRAHFPVEERSERAAVGL